ncbi:MAG TPA: hypothetical protein VKX49_16285 [Bryobacteraceae bacterium]|nr:hypothetical protein [Bryobacteraceae bacterium]
MKKTISLLFAAALLAAATGQQTFTGVITDSMCGQDHAMMKVTPNSKCVQECVRHGSKYALFNGKTAYVLSDQKAPEQFAGQKVKITGTLYEKTKILKVDSITSDGEASSVDSAQAGHQH